MKELWHKLTELSTQQAWRLLTVLVASSLGTFSTTAFLDWRITALQAGTWQVRLALTVGAGLIYALIVWASFYVLMPEQRPALKRIFPWSEE